MDTQLFTTLLALSETIDKRIDILNERIDILNKRLELLNNTNSIPVPVYEEQPDATVNH